MKFLGGETSMAALVNGGANGGSAGKGLLEGQKVRVKCNREIRQ